MRVAAWRFITTMLVALSMGLAFCHLMEMPARLSWEPALWITVTNWPGALYRSFGTVGAVVEVGAVLSAVLLVFLARRRPPEALWLTVVAGVLMLAAHAAWWVLIYPVNVQMAGWSPEFLPPGFYDLRAQWEYTHASRAGLQILALAALVASLIAEIPRTLRAQPRPEASGAAGA